MHTSHIADGTVDLWLEEEYNAASRMPAGVPYGRKENVAWSGKEKADADVAVHSVKITCAPAISPSSVLRQPEKAARAQVLTDLPLQRSPPGDVSRTPNDQPLL